MSNPVVICEKAGTCQKVATHVLIYVDKNSFREITNKPKAYCWEHAVYMQTYMNMGHNVQARLYTVKDWMERVRKFEHDKYRSDRISPRR